MGLFSRFSRKSEGMSSLELFKAIYGGRESSSGLTVNVNTALQVSTILAICRVLAEGVAQVPFRLMQETDKGKKPATKHPLYRLINRRPNRWQTSFEFRETLMFHLVLTGNAFVFKNRVGIERKLKELIIFQPGDVKVNRDATGTLTYEVRNSDGAVQTFGEQDIWHLRGPSWNTWMGLEQTQLARNAIGLGMALETAHASIHKNGAQSSGFYSVADALSDKQFEQIDKWLKRYGTGGDKRGAAMILDRSAQFVKTSMSGVDTEHLATRRFQIEQMCSSFRVMPIMVGHADKTATYASSEQMFLAHIVHTLLPWYERIQQSGEIHLLTEDELDEGFYLQFFPNALMRGAAKDRGEFYAKALGSGNSKGWMTQNDVRELEDMDKHPDPEADNLPQPVSQSPPQKTPKENEDA